MSTGPLAIEFVTRAGCTTCSTAELVVRRVADQLGIPVLLRDVDLDASLEEFSERVPVVLSASGQVLAEGRVSAGRLWLRLAAGRALGF